MASVAPLVPASLQKELGVVDVKRPLGVWGDIYETTPELRFPYNMDVYDRMRRQDSQTRALLRAIMLPMLGTKWRLEGKQVRPVVKKMVEAELGLIEDDQGRRRPREGGISWDKLLRHILLHLPMGFSPLCRWYTIDKPDFPGLPKQVAHLNLSPRMPRTIWGFQEDPDNGHLLGIWQNTITGNYGGIMPGQEGGYGGRVLVNVGGGFGYNAKAPDRVLIDRDHLVMFINEQEGTNWAGESILRSTYKHWVIKDQLIRIGALAADRTGNGLPVVTYPADADGAERTALQIASSVRVGEDSGVALPAGWTLEILGVKGTVEDALKWVNYHDQAQSRSMLAMFLDLGYSKGLGSGETTDSFLDYFLLSQKAVLRYIEEIFTEEIIRPLVRINFGPDETYPTLVADDPRSEAEPTAQALAVLTQQGILHPDVDLRSDVRRRFGLPQEKPMPQPDGKPGETADDLTNMPVGDTGRHAMELDRITSSAYHLVRAGFDPGAVMNYLGLESLPLAAGGPPPERGPLPGEEHNMPTDGAVHPPATPETPGATPASAPKSTGSAAKVPAAETTGPTDSSPTVTKKPSKPTSVHGDVGAVVKMSAGDDRRGDELHVGDAVMVAFSDGIEPGLVYAAGQHGNILITHGDDDLVPSLIPRRKVQLLLSAGDETLTVPDDVKAAVRQGLAAKAADKTVPAIANRLLEDKVTRADVAYLVGWFDRRHQPEPKTGKERPLQHTDGSLTDHAINMLLRGGKPGEAWAKSVAQGGVKASEAAVTPPPASPPTSDIADLATRLQRAAENLAAIAAARETG